MDYSARRGAYVNVIISIEIVIVISLNNILTISTSPPLPSAPQIPR